MKYRKPVTNIQRIQLTEFAERYFNALALADCLLISNSYHVFVDCIKLKVLFFITQLQRLFVQLYIPIIIPIKQLSQKSPYGWFNSFSRTSYAILPQFSYKKEIKLKFVSGAPESWFEFGDNFSLFIHNNSHLDDVQKLHYCVSFPGGEDRSPSYGPKNS